MKLLTVISCSAAQGDPRSTQDIKDTVQKAVTEMLEQRKGTLSVEQVCTDLKTHYGVMFAEPGYFGSEKRAELEAETDCYNLIVETETCAALQDQGFFPEDAVLQFLTGIDYNTQQAFEDDDGPPDLNQVLHMRLNYLANVVILGGKSADWPGDGQDKKINNLRGVMTFFQFDSTHEETYAELM